MAKHKHSRTSILCLLHNNDKAVLRGIVALYDYQTADEQATWHTTHANGVGFNGADSRKMSRYAKALLDGHTLRPWQMTDARQRLLKYATQLARIANSKAQVKDQYELGVF
jgi:hypothetical protein